MKDTKTRKKSVILTAIVLLLVAVLALGATTYAKYISSYSVTGKNATVAKWGFTVTGNAADLFSATYNKGAKVEANNGSIDVKAESEIVAPGTSGSMTVTVSGSAEVKAKVTITAGNSEDVLLINTETNETYNPLVWTIKKGDDVLATGDLVAAINAFNNESTVIEAGTTLEETTYTISWAWAFESGHDAEDTILGQFANNTPVDGYEAVTTVTLEGFSINIEQVQNL